MATAVVLMTDPRTQIHPHQAEGHGPWLHGSNLEPNTDVDSDARRVVDA
jgi:hypothetical protein